MIIFKSINKLNKELIGKKNIGFVPTMGSLHKGHISLLKKSKKNCNKVLVSIFINPTQFNNRNDYKIYPKNIKRDINLLKKYKTDYLLLPSFKEIYENKRAEKIKISKSQLILCAKYRKGHFQGVLAVINQFLKKINIDKIFLGEKDFQQLYLIKHFLKKNFKTRVIPCKTIREKGYFPCSSRNLLLSEKNRKNGRKISKILKNLYSNIKKNKKNIFKLSEVKDLILKYADKVEYLEIRNRHNLKKKFNHRNFKIFIAYYLSQIRIIDNF